LQPTFEIKNLQVLRNQKTVLEVENLAVYPDEVLAVIGPNGAGKSTLLMVASRLLQPQKGEIYLKGELAKTGNELAFRRRIGLVLQDPLLMDTSVFDNVAIGLRFRGLGSPEISRRVNYWLERLDILHLSKRRARRLSGGEAQRVSLARAFALESDLLLLDEPFSALDAPTRQRLLEDFQSVLSGIKVATLFVTHDQDEALLLGDRIAVILEGKIRQVGTPKEIFSAPGDPEIAAFVGVETIISGKVESAKEGMMVIRANGFLIEAVGNILPGRDVLLCLRPEDITLWARETPAGSSARNRISGKIVKMLPQGPLEKVMIDCGFPVVALVTRSSAKELSLQTEHSVQVSFKASAVHIIPK
jgi:molybdopterin-binding protein